MTVPRLEKSIGIEVYATHSSGLGGIIRQHAEDFVVEEVLVDGSKAETDWSESQAKHQALGSSNTKNRYLLCVMIKRNWDTFLALKAVAKQLDLSADCIQIAGIKDAKAVTAQHITVEALRAEEILNVQVKDIEVHPIGYFHSELSSYYILGNHFHITIRAISHSKSRIRERTAETVEELKAIGGAPNFFGHQRFGTTRPITHLVGKALVHGKLEKAAMLYLAKPSPYEHPESRQARMQLRKTQNFKQALKDFPKQLHYERLMLNRLAKNPADFKGAFRKLPTKLRWLFTQAYQSYLFNKSLSKRLQKGHPLNKAEAGDYIVAVERSGLPMPKIRRVTSVETVAGINRAIQAGKMRLAIPLIGIRQHPSQGAQGEIEKQILEEEGIFQESFKIEAIPELSLRGGLRTALVPLNDFSLKGISKDTVNPSKNKAEVSFTLYRGSYATVVLRELMKPRNLINAGF